MLSRSYEDAALIQRQDTHTESATTVKFTNDANQKPSSLLRPPTPLLPTIEYGVGKNASSVRKL